MDANIPSIAIASTSRADAGIYRPLLRALVAETDWRIIVLAGGTHTASAYGNTIDDFRAIDGIKIVKVDHHIPGDTPQAVAESTGRAVAAFESAITATQPDILFVLGDRTEMLAAALAALIASVRIAHLHGGDTTLGAIDDRCRDAITQFADLHFPALEQHAERIRKMGRPADTIHTVGALAIDDLHNFNPQPIADLSRAVGLDFTQPTGLVAYYPETMSNVAPTDQIRTVLDALTDTDHNLLLIGPNADVGHDDIREALTTFAANRPNTILTANLPVDRFRSCMAHARWLLGNSSAGLLEAPSLKLPVINVGNRQQGRLKPANVIDAPLDTNAIREALHRATTNEFRTSLTTLTNPYGDGQTAMRIIKTLRAFLPALPNPHAV